MRILLIFVVLFNFTKADIEQVISEKSDLNVNQQVETSSSIEETSSTTLRSPPDMGTDIPANVSSSDVISQKMSETYSSWYIPIDSKDCTLQAHCPDDKACIRYKCVNPCSNEYDGSNSECSVTNHKPVYTCKPGYTGDPLAGCIKVAGCITDECSAHDQCPATKSCIKGKCSDPCQLVCAPNINCVVINHVPACTCKDSYSGNPFTECKLQVCSGNWPPSPRGKKKYYVETSIKTDWIAASLQCLNKGYRLVAIENKQELEDVREEIRKTNLRQKNFWTSGSDRAYEGRWLWAITGEVVTYFEWLDGEPNNTYGDEDCLELVERDQNKGYKYNDQSCTSNDRYFICEYYETL